ncbi:hypothetical protein N7520_009167 [Penicillium odoratum]|uniref:uncharacterized protein n=1 Tax=Penicillium odoratum TaxID=1167516 RepID=UPI0025484ACD|nr:uncharacterized protein N7520_009167 [Penicillium odoratum]KAJ5752250.1 hypothetical protein N7520_009167 [Penicillium odoratum]
MALIPIFTRRNPTSSKQEQTLHTGGWPWGYVIYHTIFTATSDRDWAAAIEKLDRHCYTEMAKFEELENLRFRFQPDVHEHVREGYRNLIVQDPNLEGASVDAIRKRHIRWVEGRGYHFYLGIPRFDYCLFLDDRAIGRQGWPVGYVNLIDRDFDKNDTENDCSEHYDGSLRICLKDIFHFALYCEDLKTGEQQWGDWGWNVLGMSFIQTGILPWARSKTSFFVHPTTAVSSVPATLNFREEKPSQSLNTQSSRLLSYMVV